MPQRAQRACGHACARCQRCGMLRAIQHSSAADIARMNAQDLQFVIEIRIASSGDLLQAYDRRELGTVIVRFQADRSDGQLLAEEPFGWFAAPTWQHRAGEPLPLATLAEPCGVRTMARQPWALRILDK